MRHQPRSSPLEFLLVQERRTPSHESSAAFGSAQVEGPTRPHRTNNRASAARVVGTRTHTHADCEPIRRPATTSRRAELAHARAGTTPVAVAWQVKRLQCHDRRLFHRGPPSEAAGIAGLSWDSLLSAICCFSPARGSARIRQFKNHAHTQIESASEACYTDQPRGSRARPLSGMPCGWIRAHHRLTAAANQGLVC